MDYIYYTWMDLEKIMGTAPSEITGESIKQYSKQTPVFFGGEMLENIRVDS